MFILLLSLFEIELAVLPRMLATLRGAAKVEAEFGAATLLEPEKKINDLEYMIQPSDWGSFSKEEIGFEANRVDSSSK